MRVFIRYTSILFYTTIILRKYNKIYAVCKLFISQSLNYTIYITKLFHL